MVALILLVGASIAFAGFCVGYGAGHSAAKDAAQPQPDTTTRTMTNVVPVSFARLDAAQLVFINDTSRGLLQ